MHINVVSMIVECKKIVSPQNLVLKVVEFLQWNTMVLTRTMLVFIHIFR